MNETEQRMMFELLENMVCSNEEVEEILYRLAQDCESVSTLNYLQSCRNEKIFPDLTILRQKICMDFEVPF